MSTLLHNGTTIIIDDDIMSSKEVDEYLYLIKLCLDDYRKSIPSVVMVRDAISFSKNLGLTVLEIDGFILFHNNINKLAKKHAIKVNPKATVIHCIVDTCFHEMHHVESYKADAQWVIDNPISEEAFADKVASELCIEFFKKNDIMIKTDPYVYKNGNDTITDLREYFNILLDKENKWDSVQYYNSVINTKEEVVNEEIASPSPDCVVSFQEAKTLYMTCFNQLKMCEHSPEQILTTINIEPILKSALIMDKVGVIVKTTNPSTLSGLINTVTKQPAYVFELKDGKKRQIIYDQVNEIGCIIDTENSKPITMFKDGNLSAWPTS